MEHLSVKLEELVNPAYIYRGVQRSAASEESVGVGCRSSRWQLNLLGRLQSQVAAAMNEHGRSSVLWKMGWSPPTWT